MFLSLRYFSVGILHCLYVDFTVISYSVSAVICWRRSTKTNNLKKLYKLMKRGGYFLEIVLELMLQRRILHKMKNTMDNADHQCSL